MKKMIVTAIRIIGPTLAPVILAAFVSANLFSVAKATIISADDTIFGVDSITRDTDAGLEWLDVNASISRSFNDVSSQFGMGEDFEGFRHAVRSEIVDYFANAGVTDTGLGYSSSNFPSALELVNLLGVTRNQLGQSNPEHIFLEVEGLYASFPTDFAVRRVVLTARTELQDGRFFLDGQGGVWGKEDAFSFLGHFLVRSITIPEPTTLAILGLGLAGLGVMRRKRAT